MQNHTAQTTAYLSHVCLYYALVLHRANFVFIGFKIRKWTLLKYSRLFKLKHKWTDEFPHPDMGDVYLQHDPASSPLVITIALNRVRNIFRKAIVTI